MAKRDKKALTDEEKRKKSEQLQRVVLPVVNATFASIAKVLVEQFFKGA